MKKKLRDNLAPIVLFVYNRPYHTRKTIEALQKNDLAKDSELFIFSDGLRSSDTEEKILEVRRYINNVTGFKKVTVIEREKNVGLANSIIEGVTWMVNEYGKVIVLEDDLVTTPYFLKFMNESLECYKDNEDIFVVSGYAPPIEIMSSYDHDVYLTHRSSSWGWAMWKKEWNSIKWDNEYYKLYAKDKKTMQLFSKKGGVDRSEMLHQQIEGKIDSWAIRRGFSQFLQNKYTVFPKKSLVKNIGNDGSGVHCGVNKKLQKQEIIEDFSPVVDEKITANKLINKKIYKYYSPNLYKKIKNKFIMLISNE